MLGIINTQTWMQDALCAQVDPNLFFSETQGGHNVRNARRICDGCSVRNQCLEFALSQQVSDDVGVWGGTSAHERRQMRRQLGLWDGVEVDDVVEEVPIRSIDVEMDLEIVDEDDEPTLADLVALEAEFAA